MTTENPTPGQIIQGEYQPIPKEEDEKQMSNALDISVDAAKELLMGAVNR